MPQKIVTQLAVWTRLFYLPADKYIVHLILIGSRGRYFKTKIWVVTRCYGTHDDLTPPFCPSMGWIFDVHLLRPRVVLLTSSCISSPLTPTTICWRRRLADDLVASRRLLTECRPPLPDSSEWAHSDPNPDKISSFNCFSSPRFVPGKLQLIPFFILPPLFF